MSEQTVKILNEVMSAWVDEFGRAVEMFTGEKAALSFSPAASEISTSEISDRIWWKQIARSDQSFSIWAGAPLSVCQVLGGQATFFEMLSQANQGTAAVLSASSPVPLRCEDGSNDVPSLAIAVHSAHVNVNFRGVNTGNILLLIEKAAFPIIRPQSLKENSPAILSRLLDLHLPVSILLGRARISIKEALKLMPGSVIELDRQVGDYVEIMVHGTVVAKGEIVSVKGNYGVRIKQVVSRQERLALRDAA